MNAEWSARFMGAPWLPLSDLMHWAQSLSWALVVAASLVWAGGWMPARFRWLMALAGVVWVLLPGPMSPAYWLSLAFQSPSLMSVGLLALWLAQRWAGRFECAAYLARQRSEALPPAWVALWVAGVILGWVLLADMLARWPVSVYAWGFGSMALLAACGVASAIWLLWGARGGSQVGWVMAVVLFTFTVTRLPSGNVLDALIDPWLWMVLQVTGLGRLWRRARARQAF